MSVKQIGRKQVEDRAEWEIRRDREMGDAGAKYWKAVTRKVVRETYGIATEADESAVDNARSELIEVHNRYKPLGGWPHPDGQTPEGSPWQMLPQDPEKLCDRLAGYAREQWREKTIELVRNQPARRGIR